MSGVERFGRGQVAGSPAAPAFRSLVASDIPNIAESQVINLVTDLGLKAPLASPTFTGTPAAPTPSTSDNSTKLATTAFVQAVVASGGGMAASGTMVVGFEINTGTVGTNVGPMLIAPRSGNLSKCVVVTKAADGSTGLAFTIKKNGTSVFTSNPTVAAGTASGTLSTFTNLTSVPLAVAVNDVFSIDITGGTSTWQFTAQMVT